MQMTFRWFGAHDSIPLQHIRQIPGVTGIVSAVSKIPVGEAWTTAAVDDVASHIVDAGFSWAVVESIPVHEDIKLGVASRDRLIDNWCESLSKVARAGVPVVCYNFMPVFDWTRTQLALPMRDGSTALAYDHDDLGKVDLTRGTGDLPGWSTAYTAHELNGLFAQWKRVDEAKLWDNLAYFLERAVPAAVSSNIKLAMHPDDPPWSVFGLPRVLTNVTALRKLLSLVDHPNNGLTFCTGSMGANMENDVPAMVREFSAAGRIHFMHCRNVKRSGAKNFHEAPHPSRFGDVNMLQVLTALRDAKYDGPVRPDHGRMIWGETGQPGYGLHDRALGAMYLQGLWEGLAPRS